ncbi:thiol reductant ABC exporter subunit CydD [Komagataeibacter rhaeticus]|uniref:Thiol reductant ABC exporter subunit CydD n=1 Tax=Komagataeibacter rhaeticus TaxID=215221 RepID=A0A181C8P4_9PROT|nr:thiol reductant ABC exporter subunit CydD [Komagataeibacter rhaeticus]ATU73361.1 thiol reductant ABC exporter subunit CydD [Komagataeibacter xylinus]QIP34811.1 thiol reductant ABC exporter subunit CydD [Komagataeibacter rhaeticus]QOC47341.1 thiol reductant ABC exporter subunit CydD [Komagataeibacter rhaeticus]WPP23259.1 thiol reductant ABC exporter subunit CydD [Komagataeibacter rhaeticus]SAY47904.1 ATP-binding/permease protein CydD [Komagataeibacter rhaeticus]
MNDDKTVMKAWTRAQSRLGRRLAMPVVLLGLAVAGVAVGQVWCVASILACVLVPGGTKVAAWPLAGLVGLAVLRAALQMGIDVLAARAGMKARARLRGGVVDAILRGGPGLLRNHHSGELTALAVDRIEALDGFFARWLPASVLWVAAPLVIGVLAALVQPGSALIMAACGLAVPFGQALFGIGAAVASRNQFLAMTRLQARFLDRVRGIATIVLSGRTEDETRRLAASAEELRMRTMKVLRVAFLSSASIDCALVVALVLVALRNGAQIMALHEQGVPATVMAAHVARGLFVVLLVPEFFAPFRSLALAYQDRAHASGAAAAMRILPDAVTARAEGRALCDAGQGVRVAFENVGFAWDAARGATLEDISFTVPAGQAVVLWGPSGSGKSTLIEMLLGFIQPAAGRITFNGTDMAAIDPAALVAITSWIGQKPVLFAGTLRENILFARPAATEAQLQAAVTAAAADSFVAHLPHGLDTRIGEGGFGLSGGQAQRVAIARAFLKDAPLLLLDEPTSHLDPETEADVFASLRRLAEHRTVILASHSPAAAGFGGQRIDLDHGRIVTSGEHAS